MKHYADPEWSALLKAVADSPADDLPRLVAADWLDDRGDPERAEFIRLQCAVEAEADPKRVREVEWKIRTLWNSLDGQLWAVEACPNLVTMEFASPGSLHALTVQHTERVLFRRGFPEVVTCPAVDWLMHGAGIVPRQPVRRVRLLLCAELSTERWWPMLPTLRSVEVLEVQSYRPPLLEYLRKNLPGVLVTG